MEEACNLKDGRSRHLVGPLDSPEVVLDHMVVIGKELEAYCSCAITTTNSCRGYSWVVVDIQKRRLEELNTLDFN